MSSLTLADHMYAASASVALHGPEIQTASDPAGASFVHQAGLLRQGVDAINSDVWGELLQLAAFVQWRRIFDPLFPSTADDQDLIEALCLEATRLVPLVGTEEESRLSAITDAAQGLFTAENPVSALLRSNIIELGLNDVVVVALKGRLRKRLVEWVSREFPGGDVAVSVPGAHEPRVFEQAYLIGRPVTFPHRTITAPIAAQVAFLIPDWVKARSLPASPLVGVAENAISPTSWGQIDPAPTYDTPDVWQIGPPLANSWKLPDDSEFLANPGEASRDARRVLFEGGRFAYLEVDGESIRQFFPDLPVGERVGNGRVAALTPGDFLILRDDANRPDSLYLEALESLGGHAASILELQARWKRSMQDRIDVLGTDGVRRELSRRGVMHPAQNARWVEEELSRPQRISDFRIVLEWLGLDVESHVDAANLLWRQRTAVGRRITRELERAAASVEVEKLESEGSATIRSEDSARPIVIVRIAEIDNEPRTIALRNCRKLFATLGSAKWSE